MGMSPSSLDDLSIFLCGVFIYVLLFVFLYFKNVVFLFSRNRYSPQWQLQEGGITQQRIISSPSNIYLNHETNENDGGKNMHNETSRLDVNASIVHPTTGERKVGHTEPVDSYTCTQFIKKNAGTSKAPHTSYLLTRTTNLFPFQFQSPPASVHPSFHGHGKSKEHPHGTLGSGPLSISLGKIGTAGSACSAREFSGEDLDIPRRNAGRREASAPRGVAAAAAVVGVVVGFEVAGFVVVDEVWLGT